MLLFMHTDFRNWSWEIGNGAEHWCNLLNRQVLKKWNSLIPFSFHIEIVCKSRWRNSVHPSKVLVARWVHLRARQALTKPCEYEAASGLWIIRFVNAGRMRLCLQGLSHNCCRTTWCSFIVKWHMRSRILGLHNNIARHSELCILVSSTNQRSPLIYSVTSVVNKDYIPLVESIHTEYLKVIILERHFPVTIFNSTVVIKLYSFFLLLNLLVI